MNHETSLRAVLCSGLLLAFAALAYPAAFLAAYGLDPAGWPDRNALTSWFADLAALDIAALARRYVEAFRTRLGLARAEALALATGIVALYATYCVLIFRDLPPRGARDPFLGARWATSREIAALRRGVAVGIDRATNRPVHVEADGALVTLGATVREASEHVIIPNLMPDRDGWTGPAVIVDPGGLAHRAVAARRERNGRTVRLLDLSGERPSPDRWNPLRAGPRPCIRRLEDVARALLPAPSASAGQHHEHALALVVGALIASDRGSGIDMGLPAWLLDNRKVLRWFLEGAQNDHWSAARRSALAVLALPPDARQRIIARAHSALRWSADPAVAGLLRDPTFRTSDLLSGDVDLFIVPPAGGSRHRIAPLLRWMLSDLAFLAADERRRPRRPVMLFVGDAGALGRFHRIASGWDRLPEAGICPWTFCNRPIEPLARQAAAF